ncbi:cuticle collagen 2C-like [Hippopotamus amphibius kiboko]|uniref:cuticle collagen 2C-like n=1 Tax=Hippopotamus amphibius kiboko TaxID=575201 RepID=UPI002593B74A|nr:cuticle collagen 2C-like [Hippopotamus amphibius kiboko]
MSAADEGAATVAIAVGTARGSQGAPGGPGGPDGPGDPGSSGDPVNPGDPGDPGIAREAGGTAGGIPQIQRAPHAPGPGRDAAPEAGVPGHLPLQFTLHVPFPSPVEAEIFHYFLMVNAQLRGPIQRELDVNGTVLAI